MGHSGNISMFHINVTPSRNYPFLQNEILRRDDDNRAFSLILFTKKQKSETSSKAFLRENLYIHYPFVHHPHYPNTNTIWLHISILLFTFFSKEMFFPPPNGYVCWHTENKIKYQDVSTEYQHRRFTWST